MRDIKIPTKILAIGAMSLFLVVVILVIVLLIFQYLLNLNLDQTISLGQFLIELMLIPIVIIGFLFAMDEFQASQQVAKLSLSWESKTGNNSDFLVLSIPILDGAANIWEPRIIINNSGKAVSNWFLIRLEIPEELFIIDNDGDAYFNLFRISSLLTKNNVQNSPYWMSEHRPDKLVLEFMSNGDYASYPNHPLPLCSIQLSIIKTQNYPKVCTLPYTIYTNQGNMSSGNLPIIIKPASTPSSGGL